MTVISSSPNGHREVPGRYPNRTPDTTIKGILAASPKATPSNKGLIAGLIKGNQWLINP